jgi:hypothetical protein
MRAENEAISDDDIVVFKRILFATSTAGGSGSGNSSNMGTGVSVSSSSSTLLN